MTLRQVHKFEFTCDGYTPRGAVCGHRFTTSQYGDLEAEIAARDEGWTQDHRGWICDSTDGHRGDRPVRDELRYVQWAINQFDYDDFEIVRRERSGATLLGRATTMCEAESICKLDRTQTLADPRAIEISTVEVNVR